MIARIIREKVCLSLQKLHISLKIIQKRDLFYLVVDNSMGAVGKGI